MPVALNEDIDSQRHRLIDFIWKRRPHGSWRNKVTIVFDGTPGLGRGRYESFSGVDVIFSINESADDRIKRIVEHAINKKNIFVVTDDRGIRYAVRALGAKVLGVKEFLLMGHHGHKNKKDISGFDFKDIPKNVRASITSELKRIWLE